MAEETHDPLQLFRSAISGSLLPSLVTAASEPAELLQLAAYISFPQPSSAEPINLTKDHPTRFTSRPDTKDEFYTLGQLWLAWSEKDSGVRDYLVKGQAGGVGYVSVADRRLVVDYLSSAGDGGGRVLRKGQEKGALDSTTTAASVTAEALPQASESEAGPSRATGPVKRHYEVNHADLEFCKRLRSEVVELRDRNSVMRCSSGGKVNNFDSFVRNVMAEKIRALRKSMDAPPGRSQQHTQSQTDAMRGPRKAKSTTPIIIISSSPTALITMWNVRKFLEQGIFEPSELAKQNEMAQGNVRPEDMIPIIRRQTGPQGDYTSRYYVVDGVEALQKFGQDAWDRVICVFTTGQSWQFRPYKWQDPKQLFRHVKGIYFQWNNEPSNPAVKDWNVQEMRIDRLKRHTDQQVVANFWRSLDSLRKR